jgi:hypothetical protein
MTYTYDYFKKSADYIRSVTDFEPEIAIILGSCLGPFAERIENPIVIPYSEIPNFLVSTVEGHAGKLIFGTIQGRKVVCMSGRFHYYEYDTLRRQIVETAQRAFAASFFRYTSCYFPVCGLSVLTSDSVCRFSSLYTKKHTWQVPIFQIAKPRGGIRLMPPRGSVPFSGSIASGPSRLHRCAGEENGSSPHFIFRSVLTNTLLLNIIQ